MFVDLLENDEKKQKEKKTHFFLFHRVLYALLYMFISVNCCCYCLTSIRFWFSCSLIAERMLSGIHRWLALGLVSGCTRGFFGWRTGFLGLSLVFAHTYTHTLTQWGSPHTAVLCELLLLLWLIPLSFPYTQKRI
jgi:hypothetical protein